MAIDPRQWSEARRLCRRAFGSSMHFAFASVDEDGSPRATPIGSLILREDGTGYFFEEFASGLGRNLNRSPRVCILAVNSGKLFWFKSLLMGRFAEPPGLRLLGTAGPRRKAAPEERERWMRQVKRLRWLKGHALLWQRVGWVRDIQFDAIEPIRLGAMTRGLF